MFKVKYLTLPFNSAVSEKKISIGNIFLTCTLNSQIDTITTFYVRINGLNTVPESCKALQYTIAVYTDFNNLKYF